jgi:hypothetical protein
MITTRTTTRMIIITGSWAGFSRRGSLPYDLHIIIVIITTASTTSKKNYKK